MKSFRKAGDINMKGKKFKLLNCRCCEVQDLRQKEYDKEIAKELRNIWYKKIERKG